MSICPGAGPHHHDLTPQAFPDKVVDPSKVIISSATAREFGPNYAGSAVEDEVGEAGEVLHMHHLNVIQTIWAARRLAASRALGPEWAG